VGKTTKEIGEHLGQQQLKGETMKPITKKAKKAAKKLFAKLPNSTRPFTSVDYVNLPKS
jgi:hypothetical protein